VSLVMIFASLVIRGRALSFALAGRVSDQRDHLGAAGGNRLHADSRRLPAAAGARAAAWHVATGSASDW
jgi:hypothetical protein